MWRAGDTRRWREDRGAKRSVPPLGPPRGEWREASGRGAQAGERGPARDHLIHPDGLLRPAYGSDLRWRLVTATSRDGRGLGGELRRPAGSRGVKGVARRTRRPKADGARASGRPDTDGARPPGAPAGVPGPHTRAPAAVAGNAPPGGPARPMSLAPVARRTGRTAAFGAEPPPRRPHPDPRRGGRTAPRTATAGGAAAAPALRP